MLNLNKLEILKNKLSDPKEIATPNIAQPKIAVLFSGHLRAFEKCAKSIKKNLLGDQQADFYCHTWEKLEADLPKEHINPNIFTNTDTSNKTSILNQHYNIKKIHIERYSSLLPSIINYWHQAQISPIDKRGFHGGELTQYLYMLYSWKRAFELLESSENSYDLIIKCRPDLIFPEKINFPTKISSKTLYTPNIASYYHNGFNDQLCYGDYESVKYYCYMYDKVIQYVNSRVINPPRPETLLFHHMNISNMKIEIKPLKYYILRTSGTVLYPKPNDRNMHSGPYSMIKDLT